MNTTNSFDVDEWEENNSHHKIEKGQKIYIKRNGSWIPGVIEKDVSTMFVEIIIQEEGDKLIGVYKTDLRFHEPDPEE
jgi:hypothetical protein